MNWKHNSIFFCTEQCRFDVSEHLADRAIHLLDFSRSTLPLVFPVLALIAALQLEKRQIDLTQYTDLIVQFVMNIFKSIT